jgi:hypothetical protein
VQLSALHHGQVIELLQKNGGKLDYEDPSGALCGGALQVESS